MTDDTSTEHTVTPTPRQVSRAIRQVVRCEMALITRDAIRDEIKKMVADEVMKAVRGHVISEVQHQFRGGHRGYSETLRSAVYDAARKAADECVAKHMKIDIKP